MHASTRLALVLCCAAGLAAAAATAQAVDGRRMKDVLTGDADGRAADNPRCKLFTPAEIRGYVGVAVGAGDNAAGGSGCFWSDQNGANALVQVVEARYASPPSAMKGFRKLPAIGPKAWVAPDMGWSAGTVEGESAVMVNLAGKDASEAKVVAFLEETLRRRRR